MRPRSLTLKSRGFKVNERGRIPANIVAEYEAAH
jgi:hypothetical protein